MKLDLDDQVVVVTGGANGIGLATVKLFLEEHARVAIWDRQPIQGTTLSAGASPAESASGPGLQPEVVFALRAAMEAGRLIHCAVDVTESASLAAARDATLEKMGAIHHWVHAAAIGSGKFGFPFTELQPEDWERVLEVNVMGMVRAAHCLAPIFQQQKSGTMTMIGSVAGQIGSQTDPPYSASKAANINFTQCLAKDMAAYQVRVNIVHPGMVQTDLNRRVWQAWHDRQPEAERMTYEAWASAKIRQLTPLNRWQTVDDIANLIVFLASSRARNITGQSMNVDGGWVMRW